MHTEVIEQFVNIRKGEGRRGRGKKPESTCKFKPVRRVYTFSGPSINDSRFTRSVVVQDEVINSAAGARFDVYLALLTARRLNAKLTK